MSDTCLTICKPRNAQGWMIKLDNLLTKWNDNFGLAFDTIRKFLGREDKKYIFCVFCQQCHRSVVLLMSIWIRSCNEIVVERNCTLKVRSHMRGRTRAGAGGKLASTQIITCVHTCAVAERRRSGSKNRSARNGFNTQFTAPASKPRAPNHHCPQEMADPPASAPRPLRVCVNIPAVAEREYQNPPASAPQPLRACVNVA